MNSCGRGLGTSIGGRGKRRLRSASARFSRKPRHGPCRARHCEAQNRADAGAAKLFALPEAKLAQLIRPAGYFNVKARRLRSFLRVLVEECGGDLKKLFAGETTACATGCWRFTVSGRRRQTACCFMLAGIPVLWLTPTRNGFFKGTGGGKAESGKRKAKTTRPATTN